MMIKSQETLTEVVEVLHILDEEQPQDEILQRALVLVHRLHWQQQNENPE